MLSDSIYSVNFLERLKYSRDASFYELMPRGIAEPRDYYDIIALIEYAKVNRTYLTFRAAGTSLSGQSVSEGIVVDVSRHMNRYHISPKGTFVSSEPGVVAGNLNKQLKKYSRVIGPDPASINACMTGGIVANNSSGMRSGINRNAYNSVKSLKFILNNGLVVDSSRRDLDEYLLKFCPDVFYGILRLHKEINDNQKLREKIWKNYQIKNTIGYSLNAFLDYNSPGSILSKLMVGSEGTLGFIAEATFETYPEYDNRATGLLFFKEIEHACNSITSIKECGVTALEIMDYKSITSVVSNDLISQYRTHLVPGCCFLLFEFSEANQLELSNKIEELKHILKDINLALPPMITYDKIEKARMWSVRKGLLASLGATRSPGSTFILEDICVPIGNFSRAFRLLSSLFEKYGYAETGIYGHCLDGNLHFMISQIFGKDSELRFYSAFMSELADIVVHRLDGSLKAEHGTGRNMAAFVELQWGREAYDIQKRIKHLLDPDGIFNRGVIINEDPDCHIQNIKSYPILNNDADKCIECGFCEQSCPSANLTLTPRQRIVLMRKDAEGAATMLDNSQFFYNLADTCAVDGLCSVSCPVGINTGEIVKDVRSHGNSTFTNRIYLYVAQNFGLSSFALRSIIEFMHFVTTVCATDRLNNLIRSLNRVKFFKFLPRIPEWSSFNGKPDSLKYRIDSSAEFLLYSCCISRFMGKPDTKMNSLSEVISKIADKSGINLHIPKNTGRYCCGMSFASKGFYEAHRWSVNNIIEWFYKESDNGKKIIIFDSSSCFSSIKTCEDVLSVENKERFKKLKFIDISEFLLDYVLTNCHATNKVNEVVLHPTCSSIKMGIDSKLVKIAERCAKSVIVPQSLGCCGIAGDRGFLYPELPISASRKEAMEVREFESDGYYSSNIPCEIGMSQATGRNYYSIAYLVARAIGVD